MINKISKYDIVWGYSAQFLNVGAGLIIIPVAVKYLTTEDLAFWYLFIAVAGLAQLLEFGLQPTISRMTSYVYTGAKNLKSEGVPTIGDGICTQLLYDLISASKGVYRVVSLGTLFILCVFGTLYLETFPEFQGEQLLAWLVFSISTVFNFYFTYFNGLIKGRGEQAELYKITAFSKLMMLMFSIPLLFLDFGLLAMAIGTFFSVIYSRFRLHQKFYSISRPEVKGLKRINKIERDYSPVLWHASWRLGLTSLGAFLVMRSNMFLVSTFLGLKITASYALSLQIVGVLSSVSNMYFNLNMPKLNSLQTKGDKASLRAIMIKSFVITDVMYISGSLVLLFFGYYAVALISSSTQLLNPSILFILLLIYFLELNHSISATYLTTLNKVPFARASIISGVFITFLGFMVLRFTNFGLMAVLLSHFGVQLAFNNWYWHVAAYRDLRRSNN